MNTRNVRLAALSALLLSACSPWDRPVDEAVVHDAAPAVPGAVEVRLADQHDSGVLGTAAIAPEEDQTRIVLQVTGARPNVTHQAYLRRGRCEAPGRSVAELAPLVTDARGEGSSTTVVPLGPDAVLNGDYLVNLLDTGTSVSCGQIPRLPPPGR